MQRAFIYLRHGQTDWNAEGRLQGSTDIPLNETGRAQARAAAARLAPVRIDRIVSSPMARAAETADIVAAAKGLAPVRDDRLRERYFGPFDGMTMAEIHDHHGIGDGGSIWSLNAPEAEPLPAALARLTASLTEHLAEGDDHVLFVAHGALFSLLTEHLLGERINSANATPYRLTPARDVWRADPI